jgi:hypothetical protein
MTKFTYQLKPMVNFEIKADSEEDAKAKMEALNGLEFNVPDGGKLSVFLDDSDWEEIPEMDEKEEGDDDDSEA